MPRPVIADERSARRIEGTVLGLAARDAVAGIGYAVIVVVVVIVVRPVSVPEEGKSDCEAIEAVMVIAVEMIKATVSKMAMTNRTAHPMTYVTAHGMATAGEMHAAVSH